MSYSHDPVLNNVLPVPDVKVRVLGGTAKQGTWLTWGEMRRAWGDPLPEGADFEGFCNPCGGFRKHRLGCPIVKAIARAVL